MRRQFSMHSPKVRKSISSRRKKLYLYRIRPELQQDQKLKLKDKREISCLELKEITMNLLKIGFQIENINKAYLKYRFLSIDHEVNIILFDIEANIYNHDFVPKNNKGSCEICNDTKDKHVLNIESYNETILDNQSLNKEFSTINKILIDNTVFYNKNIEFASRFHADQSKQIIISTFLLEKLQKQFSEIINFSNFCVICLNTELKIENSYKLTCTHIFCRQCLKKYLTIKIFQSNV